MVFLCSLHRQEDKSTLNKSKGSSLDGCKSPHLQKQKKNITKLLKLFHNSYAERVAGKTEITEITMGITIVGSSRGRYDMVG